MLEIILFLLYIALVMGLVYWFRRILEKQHGITDLSWKMTLIVYCAAFGLPSVVVALLSIIMKVLVFIFV
jgi:hypothetical protein